METGFTMRLSGTELLCLCALAGGPPPLGLPAGSAAEDGDLLAAHLRLRRRGHLARRQDGSVVPAPSLEAPLAALARPAQVVLATLVPAAGRVARRSFYLGGATVELAAGDDGRYGLTPLDGAAAVAGRISAWWGLGAGGHGGAIALPEEVVAELLSLGDRRAVAALLSEAGAGDGAARALAATVAAPAWRAALQVIAPAEARWLRAGLTVLGGAGGAWALRGAGVGCVAAQPYGAAALAGDLAAATETRCAAALAGDLAAATGARCRAVG